MHPVQFEGSIEIKKPDNMTDEECMSAWAKYGFGKLNVFFEYAKSGMKIEIVPPLIAGIDADNFPYYLTAWKPNYEDLQALNRGEPIYIKTLAKSLPPMAVFTLNENNEGNF